MLFSPSDTLEILGFKLPDFSKPAYKYTSCEALIEILSSQTFRFSSPDKFSDTYELSFDRLDPKISPEEYQSILSNYIELTPTSESQPIPSFEELVLKIPVEQFYDAHDKFYRAIKSSAMIFCSTKTQHSSRMWKDYAHDETGVCFAFNLHEDVQEVKEFTLVSRCINYTDEIVKYKQFSTNLEEIMLATYNWIFSKKTSYKFEDEIRTYLYRNIDHIVDIENKYCRFPFKKGNILEVYFGSKSDKHREKVIEAIQQHGYKPKIYKMVNTRGV